MCTPKNGSCFYSTEGTTLGGNVTIGEECGSVVAGSNIDIAVAIANFKRVSKLHLSVPACNNV